MSIGWPQILIVALLVLLLFGRGKIASLMREMAQGIRGFRKGLAEDDLPAALPETQEPPDAPPGAHKHEQAGKTTSPKKPR